MYILLNYHVTNYIIFSTKILIFLAINYVNMQRYNLN